MSGAPDGLRPSASIFMVSEKGTLANNKLWSLGGKPPVHLGGPSTEVTEKYKTQKIPSPSSRGTRMREEGISRAV